MPIELHELKPAKGARRKRRRVGRGPGSGRGTYAGRGLKGQRARAGGKKGLKLKGLRGILMSIPKKRGFKSIYPKMEIVNIRQLQKKFKSGEAVTPEALMKKGLIDTIKRGVKILGEGEIKKKLTIVGCAVSESAKKKIEKAGGKITRTQEH